MQKIILLVGDSGAGKDFVLSVADKYDDISVIKRYISREPRKGEEPSISSVFSVDIDEIKNMDYYYEGVEPGKWYGIRKQDLQEALDNGKSPMVVCPNYNNLLQMCADFPEQVVPFFVYRGYDDSELEKWQEALIARGSSKEEIEARKDTRDKYFKELYVEHFEYYGANVILNLYGLTTEEEIKMQLEGLCQKNDITISQNTKNSSSTK